MGPILQCLYLGLIIAASSATPLLSLKPQTSWSTLIQRKYTGNQLDYLKQAYPGIYWDEAALTCSDEEFNILAETTRVLAIFTDVSEWRWDESAAWNRFFVSAKKAKGGSSWHDTAQNQNAFLSIKSNLVQLNQWPSRGKRNSQRIFAQGKQISYTCKEQQQYNKCATKTGLGAYRMTPGAYANQGWAIVFCPKFFNQRYLNDVTNGRQTSIDELATLYTYEHLLAHEILHCDLIGTKESIVDMVGNIPGQRDGQKIYGASLCHEWAWKDQRDGPGPVNTLTVLNADSYAWFLTNRWFDRAWQWNEYVGGGWFGKRDPQDDGTQEFKPDDMSAYPQDTDEIDGTPDSDTPVFADSKNCQVTGTDGDNDVICSYVGESYLDYVNDVTQPFSSVGNCTLTHQCANSDAAAIDPSCNCTCDGKVTAIDDPRCAGFQGSLPDPPPNQGPGHRSRA